MIVHPISRRVFSVSAILAGVAGTARAQPVDTPAPGAANNLGISNSSAAIHQEVVFKASHERVYGVLTDARRFDKLVLLSGAIKAMSLKATPGQIDAVAGGAFALFGGYITGRNIELTPGVRVVQAWRAASWAEHIYSIARFELAPVPEGTKLSFDQTGFPNEEASSLANGWRHHYWEPLAKVLA